MRLAASLDSKFGWETGFGPLPTRGGVSRESLEVTSNALLTTERGISHCHRLLIQELHSVVAGKGSRPFTSGTLLQAYAFVLSLPQDFIPAPEVAIDPDGEISFDWYNGDDILSISIGPSGRMAYAGSLNGETVSNTLYFGGRLPTEITQYLRALYSSK